MRPPVPYFGGKMKVGPAIAALLPAHSHYVEPYCGSLAVLFAKPPSDHETVNDPDGRVVPGSPDDWQPASINGIPFRADGRVGLLCAGWAALVRRQP